MDSLSGSFIRGNNPQKHRLMTMIRRSGKNVALAKRVYKRLRQSHVETHLICSSDIKQFKRVFEHVAGRKIRITKASRQHKSYFIKLKPQE